MTAFFIYSIYLGSQATRIIICLPHLGVCFFKKGKGMEIRLYTCVWPLPMRNYDWLLSWEMTVSYYRFLLVIFLRSSGWSSSSRLGKGANVCRAGKSLRDERKERGNRRMGGEKAEGKGGGRAEKGDRAEEERRAREGRGKKEREIKGTG